LSRGSRISDARKNFAKKGGCDQLNSIGSDFTSVVKEYWEHPATVSIIDKNLHQIEIDTVCRHLLPTDSLADIGCGDGQATISYASKVASCTGIERSQHLLGKAEKAARESGLSNIAIISGDILDTTVPAGAFDVIVTQRLLINLGSWQEQMQGILNVHRMLKAGGRYIMIENTNDAFLAMNDVRVALNMAPLPQHWHNRFFDYDELMGFLRGKFQLLRHYDFGLYYLLTRVYVPMFASFVGYGAKAVKDPIFEKSDNAARMIFELLQDRVKITGCRAFGPIQGFVLRREGGDPTTT
jgi:2-polyprenyl-3-methyl-5-hydroxy-6-metoxy-1,4-benzoquinol methylase